MKPSELSKELRRIATAIDNSKKPSKELVAKAIKELISQVETEEPKAPAQNGG